MICINYIRMFLYVLRKCNVIKTIYINFKMLPLKKAVHIPIFVYGKTIFRSLSGSLEIKGEIYAGMIKIGKNDYYVKTAIPLTNWIVNGKLIFNGPFKFLNGGYLCLSRRGCLEFGENGFIGTDYKIICFESIKIGNQLEATWNVSMYDTSFHYIHLKGSGINKLTKPIEIGNQVWIGNNSTLVKGCRIPDMSIIANMSFVNKDFTNYCNGLLIAGIPAVVKKVGAKRIFNYEFERKLDEKYKYDRTHL